MGAGDLRREKYRALRDVDPHAHWLASRAGGKASAKKKAYQRLLSGIATFVKENADAIAEKAFWENAGIDAKQKLVREATEAGFSTVEEYLVFLQN